MKIKSDFITNSSSASFILFIESTANTLEEFEKGWDEYIKSYCAEYGHTLSGRVKSWRENLHKSWLYKLELDEKSKNGTATDTEKALNSGLYMALNPEKLSDDDILKMALGEMTINKEGENLFSVSYWTSMFNFVMDDLPAWMINLIVLHNMEPKDLLRFTFKDVKLKIEDD